MKSTVLFIGEDNKVNNELFQLLNWRFKVIYYDNLERLTFNELQAAQPSVLLVSMVGSNFDYHNLFDYMIEECSQTPVITISTKDDSELYEAYYTNKNFHRILRPVLGKRVLEICHSIIAGTNYNEEIEKPLKIEDKGHILIVDDNAMVLRNIKSILETQYSVAVAPSGVHAFMAIGKKMPDLILLDYEMPGMNGKEVLEKLQDDEQLKEIPVVFLTSMDSKEIVMELLALRPAGYLLKPVDSQLLHDKIYEIIGK